MPELFQQPDMAEMPKTNYKPWIILFGSILLLAGIAYFYSRSLTPVDSYSAVFLDNGQTYFGHLKDNKLTDVYYFQVDAEQKAQLIKMGQEIHGPKDEMQLNPEHVLFTEELKADSQVVIAIKKK